MKMMKCLVVFIMIYLASLPPVESFLAEDLLSILSSRVKEWVVDSFFKVFKGGDSKETPNAHYNFILTSGLEEAEGELLIEMDPEDNGRVRVRVSRDKNVDRKQKGEESQKTAGSWEFSREIVVPTSADLDSASAKYEDGIISLVLPKLSPDKIEGGKTAEIEDRKTIKIESTEGGKNQLSQDASITASYLSKDMPKAHYIFIFVSGLEEAEGELLIEIDPEDNGRVRVRVISREKNVDRKQKGEESQKTAGSCKFSSEIVIPAGADLDSASAKYEDGIITLVLPKLSPDRIEGPKTVELLPDKIKDLKTIKIKTTEGGKHQLPVEAAITVNRPSCPLDYIIISLVLGSISLLETILEIE